MRAPMSQEEKEAERRARIEFKKEQLMKKRALLLLRHPKVKKALALIAEAHENRGTGESIRGVTIVGRSRSGKTTIADLYLAMHPDDVVNGRPRRRVIKLTFPKVKTISQVMEDLLRILGDPIPTKGSVSSRRQRFKDLLNALGVEVVLFDEGHHLVTNRSDSVAEDIANWLKEVIDQYNLTIVLFGTEEVRRATSLNEEVANRFFAPLSLTAFGDIRIVNENGKEELVELGELRVALKAIQDHFDETRDFALDGVIMARRFLLATDGLIGLMVNLIVRACRFTIEEERETISADDLARAYDLYVGEPIEGGVGNPFTAGADVIQTAFKNGLRRRLTTARGTNRRIRGQRRRTTVAEVIRKKA